MNTGTLALTCLMLCLGQQPGQDTWYTNDRNFKIPITVSPEQQKAIKQMVLYVSKDRGASWQQDGVISPHQEGFVIHAPADGEYWYRVAVVNQKGEQEPKNIFKEGETTRVVIDTLKPNVRIISAERQGDEVVVRWEIQENHPDIKSMKLRYRPSGPDSLAWSEPVPLQPVPKGEARVKAGTGKALTFRLELKDLAGNFHFDESGVAGELALANFQGDPKLPLTPPGLPGGNNMPSDNTLLPPLPPTPPAIGPTDFGKPAPPPLKPDEPVAWESNGSGPQPLPPGAGKVPPPSDATANPNFPNPAAPGAPNPPAKPLPPVQIVNNPKVVLQYELAQVGPAGVGSVELWLTRNDGLTWEPWQGDPTVDPTMRGGKYKRTLDLPGEGVYGLSLVVRNKAGRGKEPVVGDVPEIRIEVDTTTPQAALFKPEPDPEQRDALLITWEAADRNLTTQPITLEWAQSAGGPWHTIQTNLPNTGRYSWQLPAGVPVYVYLRLRVRDKAGNEGIAATDQPQLADISEPEGRLLGVNILSAAEKH